MNQKRPKTPPAPKSADEPKKQFILLRLYGVISLLAVLGLSFCVALTWLGHYHYFIDLFAHPQLIYGMAILLFLPGVILFRMKYKGAWLVLALGVFFHQGFMIGQWYFIPKVMATVEESQQPKLKVLLANVNTANTQTEDFKTRLLEADADLCVILEVDDKWAAALNELKATWPHQMVKARADNFGIAVISKLPATDGSQFTIIKETELREAGLPAVPSIIYLSEWQGEAFQLVATHPLPPVSERNYKSRNMQWKGLLEFADQSDVPTIIAGDMNLTPWSMVYRMNLHYSKMENAALGHGLFPTWPTSLPAPLQIPIDHILIDPSFKSASFAHFDFKGSDHRGVMAELVLIKATSE